MMDKHQTEENGWSRIGLEYDLASSDSVGGCVDLRPALTRVQVDMLACQKVVSWETRRMLEKTGVQARIIDIGEPTST